MSLYPQAQNVPTLPATRGAKEIALESGPLAGRAYDLQLKFPKRELVLQLDFSVLMLYQKHIH